MGKRGEFGGIALFFFGGMVVVLILAYTLSSGYDDRIDEYCEGHFDSCVKQVKCLSDLGGSSLESEYIKGKFSACLFVESFEKYDDKEVSHREFSKLLTKEGCSE